MELRINGTRVMEGAKLYIHSSELPDTLKMGSMDGTTHDACEIYMDDIHYRAYALNEGDEL